MNNKKEKSKVEFTIDKKREIAISQVAGISDELKEVLHAFSEHNRDYICYGSIVDSVLEDEYIDKEEKSLIEECERLAKFMKDNNIEAVWVA